MDGEDVVYVEPVVMGEEREVEKGYSAFQKILLILGAFLAAMMAYRLVKGKTLDALTLPLRFALMILLLGGFLAFLVVGFLAYVVITLAPFLIAGGLFFLVVKSFLYGAETLSKPRDSPVRLTDKQLSRIYTRAMDDLENSKISEKEFLRVARRVREYN